MHINLQQHFEALEQAAPWILVPWWILRKGKWSDFRRLLYVLSAALSLYIIGSKADLRGNFTAKCLRIILATSVDCCENIAFLEI